MRNVFLSAILIFIAISARCQWVPHPSGTTTDIIYSVQMVSASQGYWAGEYGVYKTNSGGTSWFLTSPSSMHYFVGRDMHFFDANTGVVSGTNDQSQTFQMWYTSDGGGSWSNVYTGSIGAQTRGPYMSFAGADTGYAVQGYGTVLRTVNGGQSWSVVTYMNMYVNRIFFTSASVGYAATPSGILKTTNKGVTWTPSYSISSTNGIADVHFTDDSTGYASDADGAFIKTTNAGATWSRQELPRRHPDRLTFIGSDTAFTTNEDGTLLRTTTAGLYWEQLTLSTAASAYFNDVHFNSGTGVVVGDNGQLFTTGNYGGGVGKPIASFDRLSAACDTLMQFSSTSWSGYSRQWYFNNQPVSTAPTYTHPAVFGSGSDVVSLVVSNGTYTDTFSRAITRLSTNYTPDISRVHILRDTICGGDGVYILFDTSSQQYNREVYANGQLKYSLYGNIYTPATFSITNLYDSARIVIRISNHYSPCGTIPSDSLVREVYISTQGNPATSLLDTLVCSRGTVRVRIDRSSRWYGYYIYGMHDTVQGTGGTIYLTDTLRNAVGDSFAYVPVFQRGILNCGYNWQLSNKKAYIRYPRTDFSALDSMVYAYDQISLHNTSSADSYRWYFDNTASITSSTAFAPVISYSSTGEKRVMLISDVIQHCKSDTLVKIVFVSDSIGRDTVGGICFDGDIDTTSYGAFGGITSYHVDRFGSTYVGGYEFCCFAGANYSTSTGAYLRKTDNRGNLVWYKDVLAYYKNNQFYFGSNINAITTDPSGNVYVAGNFGTNGGWQFGSIPLSHSMQPGTSTNGPNFFVAKFDSTGQEKWMINSYLIGYGGLSFPSFLGGTDIQYVDDEHIYLHVLCTNGPNQCYVQYTDSMHYQTFDNLNVMQITASGLFRSNTTAHAYLTANQLPVLGVDPVLGLYQPVTDQYSPARGAIVGPKMHIRGDCSIDLTGFFTDSITFAPGISISGYGGVMSMFTARMSPAGGWSVAHTLYGTGLRLPESKTLGIYHYSSGDWIPRYTYDSRGNIYVASHIDSSFYLKDTITGINLGNYNRNPEPVNSYTLLAKFDPDGHNLWYTRSRNYSGNHHITGVNLTLDESQLILTGFYTNGINLSSVHRSPSLLHTAISQAPFMAAVDTAGDVRWINSIGSGGSINSIFSLSRSNGDIYTIGHNSGRSHQTIYNPSGTCHAHDTVAAAIHCRGIYIGISAGSLPVCGHDSIDYKAFTFGDFTGATYHWQIDQQYVVASGDQIHLTSPQDGQALRCTAILSSGDSIFSNEVILQVRARDTLLVQALMNTGYHDHMCPNGLGSMGATATVSHQHGYPVSYQWLVNSQTISSTQSMTAVTLRVGDSIRCIVSLPDDAYCILAPATSNSIVMKALDVDTPVITRSHDTLFCSPAVWYRWYDVGNFAGTRPYLVVPHGYLSLPAWPHIYTVQISDSNGCTTISLPDTVVILDTVTTATRNITQGNVRVYPTPNDGHFVVESNGVSEGYIEIYDTYGKLVYTRQLTSVRQNVDANELAKGIYTVFVKNDLSSYVIKIMIE